MEWPTPKDMHARLATRVTLARGALTERLDIRVSPADVRQLQETSAATGLTVATIVRLGIPMICEQLKVDRPFADYRIPPSKRQRARTKKKARK